MAAIFGKNMTGIAARQPELRANPVPRHVAIIMDGNGRWARQRGMNRIEGHRHGVQTVRRIVRHAGVRGIAVLTLFAFSSENWNRPRAEVRQLMVLLRRFVRQDLAALHEEGVRVRIIGSREGLDGQILRLIEESEQLTAQNRARELLVAFNYGAQDEITRAVRYIAGRVEAGELCAKDIDAAMVSAHLDTAGIVEPDLLIRTSGEKRLSNFLLWQSAYTEFVFSDRLWPDFDETDFDAALAEFAGRQRRFGGIGNEDIA